MGEHRRTRRLIRAGGLDSFGLHTLAILHCARYLTDGFVEQEFVDETLTDGRVRGKARDALLERLEEHGQWVRCDGGWSIHDYLDHNPSRVEVEARRAADAARKARGRRTESRQSPNGVPAESARPDPALPIPTQVPLNPPPSGGRQRTLSRWNEAACAWASVQGVSGSKEVLLRALEQARPWEQSNPPEHFRAFVELHFPTSLSVDGREAAA